MRHWLRSGNSGNARGVRAFLAETLARLPEGMRLYALRADAGFFLTEFLDELESRGLPYAIVVRMTKLVQHEIVGVRGLGRVRAGSGRGGVSRPGARMETRPSRRRLREDRSGGRLRGRLTKTPPASR